MKIRHALALTAAPMAALAVVVAAGPANAAPGDTTTTFTVASGALSITVPATANLGSGAPGTSISAQLGSVQVTDARAQLTTAWTASVTAGSFTTGGATTPETVPNTDVSYWSGAATASTGNGTVTPGQANVGAAVVLSASRTAFSLSAGTGDNSVAWNPTVIVAVPISNASGVYTGTVTHSVA